MVCIRRWGRSCEGCVEVLLLSILELLLEREFFLPRGGLELVDRKLLNKNVSLF